MSVQLFVSDILLYISLYLVVLLNSLSKFTLSVTLKNVLYIQFWNLQIVMMPFLEIKDGE